MRATYVMPIHFVRICFVVAAIIFSMAVSSQIAAQDVCEESILPEPVKQVLKAKYSDWRPLNLNDLSAEHQQYWLQSDSKTDCPGFAAGHFESKKSWSYSLSLVPRNSERAGQRIMVLRKNKKGTWEELLLQKVDVAINPNVVYRVPPGKYVNTDETETVQLQLDGFQVERMEVAAVLYYWKNGMYRKLFVSN